MSEPGQEEVQEGELKRPAGPILPPLQRVPRPPMSAPGRGPPPRPPGGFGGSPSAEALAKAQEAIAKFKLQQSGKKEDDNNSDRIIETERPNPQLSEYHKSQASQFQTSFADTIDGHHREAAISQIEANPYEESATDYSEASEMDNSSHHSAVKIREKVRVPLSRQKERGSNQGKFHAKGDNEYLKDAEIATYLSPVKVKQGDGIHFNSPLMAALAFDEEAAEEGRDVEGVYDDDIIPDHTSHAQMQNTGMKERGEDNEDEESAMWSPGGTKSRSRLGRGKGSGICSICLDFAKDCASYLKEIECEELIPDCRPKTWYRLICTAKGRGSVCRPALIMLQAYSFFATDSRTWRAGMPAILLGLAASFAVEILSGPNTSGPHYNPAVMLVLMVGVGFEYWPSRRMAPQIIISLLTGISFVIDFITVVMSPNPPTLWIRVLTAYVMLAKAIALYSFLKQAPGTLRARRYLWRRIRLFVIPLNEPRRLMKDVRGRMLALGWLHLVCACLYLGFFIASVTTFGYQVVISSGRASVSLSMFLLFKSITTAALFIGLALDIDPVLCLAYFGCLGFNMRFVKDYTRSKRQELGGWPYPFFFNSTRFALFEVGKFIDFVWGIVGWSTLSVSFGSNYNNLEASLRFVITMVYVTLFFSDVWGALLTYSVHWLTRRHAILEEHDALSDSDDSELDDLGIRAAGDSTPLTAEGKRNVKRRQRREYSRSISDLYGKDVRGKNRGRGRGRGKRDNLSSDEGDSDADMYGAYTDSDDSQDHTLFNFHPHVQQSHGASSAADPDSAPVGSSPWLRRRGSAAIGGTKRDEVHVVEGVDEADQGPWNREKFAIDDNNDDEDDEDDTEVRSDDSEATRKRKRAARRLAIKALLSGKTDTKLPISKGGSIVMPGKEGEHARMVGGSKTAVQKFKDSVLSMNRGLSSGVDRKPSGDDYDHLADMADATDLMRGGQDSASETEMSPRLHREVDGANFSKEEMLGGDSFDTTRAGAVRVKARNLGSIDDLFSGMQQPLEAEDRNQDVDTSIDYGTYSANPSEFNSPARSTSSPYRPYDPTKEGAFTWQDGSETPAQVDSRRDGYYASSYHSPEEANDLMEQTTAAMEVSFDADVATGTENKGSHVEEGIFDLSFEHNPYEVTVDGGGFRGDDDVDEGLDGIESERQERELGENEDVVSSPLIQQYRDTVETMKDIDTTRVVSLKPGSLITSPPKELMEAYAANVHHTYDSADPKRSPDTSPDGQHVSSKGLEVNDNGKNADIEYTDTGSSKHGRHAPLSSISEEGEDGKEGRDLTVSFDASMKNSHEGTTAAGTHVDQKAESKIERALREEREREENEAKLDAISDEGEPILFLDHQAHIEPEAFASLYDVLSPACDFSCKIRPISGTHSNESDSTTSRIASMDMTQVLTHLQSVGFQVVATGGAPGYTPESFRMFLFASGYQMHTKYGSSQKNFHGDKDEDGQSHGNDSNVTLQKKKNLPIFCLSEVFIRRKHEHHEWELCVNVKCTQKRFASGFVAELSLGSLFELL